ncbi:hypothetical protein CMV_007122 [Castanea mollissima]|nr:hypothetical protein CMV_007122 [Castanea mollissima]
MALTLCHAMSRLSLFHRNSQIPPNPNTNTNTATSIHPLRFPKPNNDLLTLKTTTFIPNNTHYAPVLTRPRATAQPQSEGIVTKKGKQDSYAEARAIGRYIPMSANKARRAIDQIRGRSYEESLMILELMPYRACDPILKLVYSAAANASKNMGLNEASLVVSKAEVNEGPTRKKARPQARGRVHPIRRRSCHITVVLKDTSL